MFDKSKKKYCAPRKPDHKVIIKFKNPICISGYGYSTANDCPHRDPGKFSLLAKKSDGQIVTLHQKDVMSEPQKPRHTWSRFEFAPTMIDELYFIVHSIMGPGKCKLDLMQFQELEVSVTSALVVDNNQVTILSAIYGNADVTSKVKELMA
jgi:hypothetical protein